MARLRYDIDGPLVENIYKEARWTVRGVRALTGVVGQRNGKKWITVDKYEEATFTFPAKMLAPDKPFVMPEKTPLLVTRLPGKWVTRARTNRDRPPPWLKEVIVGRVRPGKP